MDKKAYTPGVCNIGQAEIVQRNRAGLIGVVATLITAGLLYVIDAPRSMRFILAVPASMAAIGYLQSYFHFCIAFGLAGVQNFGPNAGKTDTVEQAEFRRQDRNKAIQIMGYGLLIGLAVGLLAYSLPY